MNEIKLKDDSFFEWIKSVLLKYCPIVENRIFLLDNGTQAPEMDIEIDFSNNESYVYFLFGNYYFKHSQDDRAVINKYIDIKEITNFMDYVLSDHDYISGISIDNNAFEMKFSINWSEKTLSGLSCSNITIKLNFLENSELAFNYISFIINKYISLLDNVPSFKAIKDKFISQKKEIFLNSASRDELLNFITSLDDNKLRGILFNVSNDDFISYMNSSEQVDDRNKLVKR